MVEGVGYWNAWRALYRKMESCLLPGFAELRLDPRCITLSWDASKETQRRKLKVAVKIINTYTQVIRKLYKGRLPDAFLWLFWTTAQIQKADEKSLYFNIG